MTYELPTNMNREVSPFAIIMTLLLLVGILMFLVWKVLLTPLDNPEPPEIQPGPTGKLAAPPRTGMPSPSGRR